MTTHQKNPHLYIGNTSSNSGCFHCHASFRVVKSLGVFTYFEWRDSTLMLRKEFLWSKYILPPPNGGRFQGDIRVTKIYPPLPFKKKAWNIPFPGYIFKKTYSTQSCILWSKKMLLLDFPVFSNFYQVLPKKKKSPSPTHQQALVARMVFILLHCKIKVKSSV